MNEPTKLDIEIVQGDDFVLELHLNVAGEPQDVSDRSYAAQIRQSFRATQATAFSVDMADAAEGVVRLHLTDTQTRDLRPGIWDVRETLDEQDETLFQGEVRVIETVTR